LLLTKLNASGSSLVYSTYIGGSSLDWGRGIVIDGSGSAYVTGCTWSTDYDVTSGAFQTTNGGNADVLLTKLNASGSSLVYSTYIGGSSNDEGYGIAVDGSGSAYVTGYTNSTNYDVTAGAFQTTNGGLWDVFVTKLNASGSGLVYSTYIGGSGDDVGYGITVDGSGSAYITGYTQSTDYDVTAGAFQTTYGGGTYDVFVTKLDFTVTSLQENTITSETKNNFSLYPNPAQNYVIIENYTNSVQEYELSDISGKVLQVYTLPQGKNNIELNLPKGMYFIRARRGGKAERFVVE
ncbi:MAG: SBBP repeat-containing protein, partial [Bacteroidia bacterium]|nr:SBBP repeat-containing protein [Bacteroidia bacterium]